MRLLNARVKLKSSFNADCGTGRYRGSETLGTSSEKKAPPKTLKAWLSSNFNDGLLFVEHLFVKFYENRTNNSRVIVKQTKGKIVELPTPWKT